MEKVGSQMIGMLALMIPILAIVLYSPVGRAYAQRLLTENAYSSEETALLKSQLAQLQHRVIQQQEQIERLQEDLGFQRKLLTEQLSHASRLEELEQHVKEQPSEAPEAEPKRLSGE